MNNIISRTFLFLAIFVVTTGFMMPQKAMADTFLVNGWGWEDGLLFNSYVFTVGLDKSVYAPGATIIATTQFLSWSCSNGQAETSGSYNYATVNATINGTTQTVLNKFGSTGSKNYTAPSISGNYFVVFKATALGNDHTTLLKDMTLTTPVVATISIPYSVLSTGEGTTGGTNSGGPIPGGTNTGGGTIGGNVAGGTITGSTITGGTITGSTITGSTITGGTNTSGTITGGTITTGPNTGRTITGGTITGGTITGGTITGGTTVGSLVSGGTVTGGTISGGTVTGGTISGGTPPMPPPTVSISATPNRVVAGNNTTVSWNASNVTSCSVTKNGASWQSVVSDATKTQSKSFTDTINVQTAYVITCVNGTNQTVASTVVNVTSVFQGF